MSRWCVSGDRGGCSARRDLNPLNTELNPICHLLALLGAHHILHFSRIRVNLKQSQRIAWCSLSFRVPVCPPNEPVRRLSNLVMFCLSCFRIQVLYHTEVGRIADVSDERTGFFLLLNKSLKYRQHFIFRNAAKTLLSR